jgi:hypothetical protein
MQGTKIKNTCDTDVGRTELEAAKQPVTVEYEYQISTDWTSVSTSQ